MSFIHPVSQPWRVTVSNMGVNSRQPVFITTCLRHTEPLEESHPALEASERHTHYLEDGPLFMAYRNPRGTLVSTMEDPLVYLTAESIIQRVLDVPTSYVRSRRPEDMLKESSDVTFTYLGHQRRLVHEYWDDTLSDDECTRLFSVVGYHNRQGELSIIPRSIFKQVITHDLSATLLKGLPFSEDISHSMFTIEFQRYHTQ